MDVDFTGHSLALVGIGHSTGAVALCVIHPFTFWDMNTDQGLGVGDFRAVITPRSSTARLILCENVMKAPSLFMVAQKRRDIWPSAEEAYSFLTSHPSWKV